MGICTYCIYQGDEINMSMVRRRPDFRPDWAKPKYKLPQRSMKDYICKNENNADVDTVTGEYYFGSCRGKNRFGECLFYDDGSVPFYAWKKDILIFTLSDKPVQDDKYFDIEGTELGDVMNTAALYCWKFKDETEEEPTPLYYTLTDKPQVDYDVFNIKGETIGTVKEVTDESIIILIEENEVEYVRNEESDIEYAALVIDSDFYFRSEEDDTRVIFSEEPDIPDNPVSPEPTDPEPTDPVDPDPIEP